MSRELTTEEVRRRFLQEVWAEIEYWDAHQCLRHRKLESLAFSILVLLDGGSVEMPGFVLAPAPHPDNKRYSLAEGKDYYPEAPDVPCNIAGCLHEEFYNYKPR